MFCETVARRQGGRRSWILFGAHEDGSHFHRASSSLLTVVTVLWFEREAIFSKPDLRRAKKGALAWAPRPAAVIFQFSCSGSKPLGHARRAFGASCIAQQLVPLLARRQLPSVFRALSVLPPDFVSGMRREAGSIRAFGLMVAGAYQAPAHPNPKPPANATATSQIVGFE